MLVAFGEFGCILDGCQNGAKINENLTFTIFRPLFSPTIEKPVFFETPSWTSFFIILFDHMPKTPEFGTLQNPVGGKIAAKIDQEKFRCLQVDQLVVKYHNHLGIWVTA